jgi:hypothetical protein
MQSFAFFGLSLALLGRSADVARMGSASVIDRILAEQFTRKKRGPRGKPAAQV